MEKFNLPYVVVFIPAYNEAETITNVINIIKEKYQGPNQKDYVLDVIVVDDGSKDKTIEVVKKVDVRKLVIHPYNRGLGASTRTGMQTALEMGADIVVKIDADMQNPPEDIEKVIRPILDDRADCVFGSRLMGGLQYKMPLYRDIGNKFFAWLTSLITGLKVTDATTGLMAFNKRYLKVFNIISDYNETQQLIIDSWGKHMRVIEVSTVFRERKTGKSFIKAGFKYPRIVIPTMFRNFIHFKPLRFFFCMGMILILIGTICWSYIIFFNQPQFFSKTGASILITIGFQIIFFGLLADQISYSRK